MFRSLHDRYFPQQPTPGLVEQVGALARVELAPFWLFWQTLQSLRPWWALLLPLLLWYGLRRYRYERAELRAKRLGR